MHWELLDIYLYQHYVCVAVFGIEFGLGDWVGHMFFFEWHQGDIMWDFLYFNAENSGGIYKICDCISWLCFFSFWGVIGFCCGIYLPKPQTRNEALLNLFITGPVCWVISVLVYFEKIKLD